MSDILSPRISITEVVDRVIDILKEVYGHDDSDDLSIDFNIRDSLDSEQLIEFLVSISDEYGVMLGFNSTDASALESVGLFADWIVKNHD